MSENTANMSAAGGTTTETAVPTGAPVQAQPSVLGSFTPLILIMIAFYFLLFRPQQKREAKRREMINAVKKGDRVVTVGGIIGSVHKIIDEREISLEVSENVRMRILKNAITEVLGKSNANVPENEKSEKSPKAVSLASIDKNENEKLESEKVKVKN